MSRAYLLCCVLENEGGGAPVRGPARTETVRYRDLVAVLVKVGQGALPRPDDRERERAKASYQRVNTTLARHHTVIPVRFGTVVPSRQDAEDFLTRSYLPMKSAASRVRDRVEFNVRLSWKLADMLKEVLREEEKLRNAVASSEVRDPVEAGRLLFEVAERKRAVVAETAHRRLSVAAVDSVEGSRSDASVVMNNSYLIERPSQTAFDAAMEELGGEGASYLHYEYAGPLPPYSFVRLELARSNCEVIDRARLALGLPERARLGDIKAAYRRAAARYHPDRNPEDPRSQQRFSEAVEAYGVLRAYCDGRDGVSNHRDPTEYSFAEEDVRDVFLVKDR